MINRKFAAALAAMVALAGPALAAGDGGCNWGAYFQSAGADETASDIRIDDENTQG